MNYSSINQNVAKKYAAAFIAVFPKLLNFADIQKIKETYKFLQTNRRTLFFLQLPQLDQEIKKSMIADFISYFDLPEQFSSLLVLLINHNRTFYIPRVLWFIMQAYKDKTNSVEFSIISSHHLDEKNNEQIKQFLKQRTGKNIIQTSIINPSLIAGLRLQSNDHLWEYSVRKQITTLYALKK